MPSPKSNARETRELSQIPLSVSTEWFSVFYTTDHPKLNPHWRWDLRVTVRAEQPLRVLTLQVRDEVAQWRKMPERGGHHVLMLRLSWPDPSPAWVDDSRAHIDLDPSHKAMAGEIVPIASSVDGNWLFSLVALERKDTELRRNGRWLPREGPLAALPSLLESSGSGTGAWHG